jgi:hypothetical protein
LGSTRRAAVKTRGQCPEIARDELDCTWPAGDPAHGGFLAKVVWVLNVADRSLSQAVIEALP